MCTAPARARDARGNRDAARLQGERTTRTPSSFPSVRSDRCRSGRAHAHRGGGRPSVSCRESPARSRRPSGPTTSLRTRARTPPRRRIGFSMWSTGSGPWTWKRGRRRASSRTRRGRGRPSSEGRPRPGAEGALVGLGGREAHGSKAFRRRRQAPVRAVLLSPLAAQGQPVTAGPRHRLSAWRGLHWSCRLGTRARSTASRSARMAASWQPRHGPDREAVGCDRRSRATHAHRAHELRLGRGLQSRRDAPGLPPAATRRSGSGTLCPVARSGS